MRNLVIALLVLSVSACAPAKRDKTKKTKAAVVKDQEKQLAAKDANGESKNEFKVSLNSSANGSIVAVPYAFNTEQYKSFTVTTPVFTAEGCRTNKKGGAFQPKPMRTSKKGYQVLWSKKAGGAKQNLAFDKEQATKEQSDEIITLNVFVPASCTSVSGTFTVKFNKVSTPEEKPTVIPEPTPEPKPEPLPIIKPEEDLR